MISHDNEAYQKDCAIRLKIYENVEKEWVARQEAKRIADEEQMIKANQNIVDAFIKYAALAETDAERALIAIRDGRIPNVLIKY